MTLKLLFLILCFLIAIHAITPPPIMATTPRMFGPDPTEVAVHAFLSTQKNDVREEVAQPDSYMAEDMDSDGHPEIVLVWSVIGPASIHRTLTVLSGRGIAFSPAASLPLEEDARIVSVKKGDILLEESVYVKGDRRCCPSGKKQVHFYWRGRTIEEQKN